MKKYEYKWIDLSPTWSLNKDSKMNEMMDRLNELGQEGWLLISGLELGKYSVFVREIQIEQENSK